MAAGKSGGGGGRLVGPRIRSVMLESVVCVGSFQPASRSKEVA